MKIILLPQEVEMTWTNKNKKYYMEKGYRFTKIHDKFKVNILDLPPNSSKLIKVKCDICAKVYELRFEKYTMRVERGTAEKIYCKDCIKQKTVDKYEGIQEKKCKDCGNIKPLNDFEKRDGRIYRNICKDCRKNKRLEIIKNRVVANDGEKQCKKCFKFKHMTDFNVNKSANDGRDCKCKVCFNEEQEERRKRHKENLTITFFNYRAVALNNGSKRRGALDKITGEDLKNIYEKQNGKCIFCGESLDGLNLAFDHMISIKKGGKNNRSNICATCSECNRLKFERTSDEFIIFIKLYVKRIKEMVWFEDAKNMYKM